MTTQALIVGLGEVLWDVLPSGTVLGGAPTNFAYMAQVLGDEAVIASRVGDDELGNKLKAEFKIRGLSKEYLQVDPRLETSTTQVVLDAEGQPTFTIKQPVAWDCLQWSAEWAKLAREADVVCFGSLAQRSSPSACVIDQFLRLTRSSALRIFDVNLRPPFYTLGILERSFNYADVVKLNEQELGTVSRMFQIEDGDDVSRAKLLLRMFGLRLVCITRGAQGSVLVGPEEVVEHVGIKVRVADTIGAGDAFTACLAHHLIRGRSLCEISEAANQFASWVATQVGATPSIDRSKLQVLAMKEAV
jgi:fructokinase